MTGLAIIGGTGLTSLKNLEIERREVMHTPFGEPSGPLVHGTMCGRPVVFIPRHGTAHTIPPHEVNYRANMWALHHIGINKIIAVAAVGGITQAMAPQALVVPDQIIDYTYSRQHTFFQGELTNVTHVDFTQPYSCDLRKLVLQAGRAAKLDLLDGGTYGATQGPRLETAAEITRLERDGCDIVGMTGMPEAALARELGIAYAAIAVVANWAAGRAPGEISMEDIERNLKTGMDRVRAVLEQVIPIID